MNRGNVIGKVGESGCPGRPQWELRGLPVMKASICAESSGHMVVSCHLKEIKPVVG